MLDTGRPYVYLPCYPNSSWGDEPYFSTCLKPPDRIELPIDQIAKVRFCYFVFPFKSIFSI